MESIYRQKAIDAVVSYKHAILPIPEDTIIAQEHLSFLTNIAFVKAFADLQTLVRTAYTAIEQSPEDWGFPDFETTDGYYHRVVDFLFAFAICGCMDKSSALVVDTKQFFAHTSVKRHKKQEMMASSFEKTGLSIDNFSKKSQEMRVTYPENPDALVALHSYVRALGDTCLHWSAREMSKWDFCHRYIQCESQLKWEREFHAKMDHSTPELLAAQEWLHVQAQQYGYCIDSSHPYEKNCIQYKSKSKVFLLIGENWENGKSSIFSKVILRSAFDKQPELIERMNRAHPEAFKSNCILCNGYKSPDEKCSMRICFEMDGQPRRCCAYQSFRFTGIDREDCETLLALFVGENKLKLV